MFFRCAAAFHQTVSQALGRLLVMMTPDTMLDMLSSAKLACQSRFSRTRSHPCPFCPHAALQSCLQVSLSPDTAAACVLNQAIDFSVSGAIDLPVSGLVLHLRSRVSDSKVAPSDVLAVRLIVTRRHCHDHECTVDGHCPDLDNLPWALTLFSETRTAEK